MPNEELILLTKSEAKELILGVLREYDESKQPVNMQSYSINQAAKKLHRHHSTIKGLIKSGQLKATSDGRITMVELNRYLAGISKSK